MPWILLPLIFAISLNYSFKIDNEIVGLTLNSLLIPLSVVFGLRYGERGVIVLLIGSIPIVLQVIGVQPVFLTEAGIKIKASGDVGKYLVILILSSISAYYPEIIRKPDISKYRFPLWPIPLLALMVTISGGSYKIAIGQELLLCYVFAVGYFSDSSKLSHKSLLTYLIIITALSVALYPKISLNIEQYHIKYIFRTLWGLVTCMSAYFAGKALYNVRAGKVVQPKRLKISLLVIVLLIFSYIGGVIKLHDSTAFQFYYIFGYHLYFYMFSAFLIGIYLKSIGVGIIIILSTASVIISYYYTQKGMLIDIGNDHISINIRLSSYSVAVKMILISLIGMYTYNIKNNILDREFRSIQHITSDSIRNIYFSLILIIPTAILLGLAVKIFNSNPDLIPDASNILSSYSDESKNIWSEGYILLSVMAVTFYLLSMYIPIYLSTLIIKKNSIIFNRENFPEYDNIHTLLDKYFGLDRYPTHIVSANRVAIWGAITNRSVKVYSAIHPVLLSSTFNQVSKNNDKQLIYILFRQNLKEKLGYVNLWWYMYPLTFVPFLNYIYLYGKRLTLQHSSLYAYKALTDIDMIDIDHALAAIVSEETEVGMKKVSNDPINITGTRNLAALWMEYFSARPHMQTILYSIRSFDRLIPSISITNGKYGYNFKHNDR